MRPDRPRGARAAAIAACEVRLARRRVAVAVGLAALLLVGWLAVAHSATPARAQAQGVQWSERAPLPEPNSEFAVYHPAADRWRTLADLPPARNHLAAAAIDGRLHIIGGRFGAGFRSEMTDALEVYDPATDCWRRLAPLPVPVHGVTGAAFIDGWVHLPGGGTRRGGSSGSTLHRVFRAGRDCG